MVNIKKGLLNPRETLLYLVLGSRRYKIYQHNSTLNTDYTGFNMEPQNILEKHMTKPTDICKHLATLYMLTCEFNLKTIVELGTRSGESTIALLEAAKRVGGQVYSIDIDPCQEAKRIVKQYGFEKYWIFIQDDDLKIEWNKTIDHLFIDTVHTFEHTLKELKKYEQFVRNGGILTMHDIVTYPEVLRAINHYVSDRKDLHLYKYFDNNGLAVIFKR